MCIPALWSDREVAGYLSYTFYFFETPIVSRNDVVTEAIPLEDSCFLNLTAIRVICERLCDSM